MARIGAAFLLAGMTALSIGCSTMSPPPAGVAERPWMDRTLSADRRADALVQQMTRDEKLTLVLGYFATDFPPKNYKVAAEARAGSAGYVPGVPRLGIPPQWETDAGVGVATQPLWDKRRERTALPSGLGTAATWDRGLAYQGGAMIGREARASGFNVMLAGGVNLMREPRNGRNFEYGGEDPLLAGSMVGAQVAGIQSNQIISTVKHYAVNDQETQRDRGNSVAADRDLRMSDLLAFQLAIERGDPGSVMASYNKVNGLHASENPYLLTEVLRRDWGFAGYVMSDWGGVHSTVAAANAGLDQESGYPFDAQPFFGEPLKAAIERGEVSEARLTEMARRILRSMFAHGVIDNPVTEAPLDLPRDMLAAHAAITRADAEQGMVLLKNQGGLLPLSPSVRSIAVIGGRADKGVIAGSGSSLVHPVGGNAVPGLEPKSWPGPVMYYPSAPLDAIRRQAPDASVRFAAGSDKAEAAALARDSDVAIVFVTQWAGEAFDVSLTLTDDQDALVAAVAAANPRVIVVAQTNGPILMPWIDRVPAVLAAWYPGTQGGEAIAKLLFGKVNPSGRLPATFPRGLDQLPHPEAPHDGDVNYTEGATVGYKWYDAQGHEPLFPFGHGLSYTSFAYDRLRVQAEGLGLTARFRVRNTGGRAGAAVPQVYVGPASGGWEAPKRLGGWDKLPLAPGKSREVTVRVDPRLLATWENGQWRIAAGNYRVMLGASSRDIGETATVRLPAKTLPASWRP